MDSFSCVSGGYSWYIVLQGEVLELRAESLAECIRYEGEVETLAGFRLVESSAELYGVVQEQLEGKDPIELTTTEAGFDVCFLLQFRDIVERVVVHLQCPAREEGVVDLESFEILGWQSRIGMLERRKTELRERLTILHARFNCKQLEFKNLKEDFIALRKILIEKEAEYSLSLASAKKRVVVVEAQYHRLYGYVIIQYQDCLRWEQLDDDKKDASPTEIYSSFFYQRTLV